MKNQSHLDTVSSLFSHEEQHQETNHQLKCSAKNIAFEMCINDKCQQSNPFQCITQNCPCHKDHLECVKVNTFPVVDMINAKLNTDPLKKAISAMIQQKIDQLSLLQQTLLQKISNANFIKHMTDFQMIFSRLAKGQTTQKISSCQAKTLWESAIVYQSQKSNALDDLNKKLQEFGRSMTQSVNKLIHWLVEGKWEFEAPILRQFMNESRICKTEQLSERMVSKFNRKIRRLEYHFCASQNEFKMAKFYEKCESLTNILIICKTQHGKVIGGYTPIPYYTQQKKIGYVEDPSGESFLFSLTDDQKFTLQNAKKAIYRQEGKSFINIGGCQFTLCDQAHTKYCYAYVNQSNYVCAAYEKMNQNAYMKFTGSLTQAFKASQWEAWKIDFVD